MPSDDTALLYGDITNQVIKAGLRVMRTLGSGFMEKVYENALVIELKRLGLEVAQQHPIVVLYSGQVIGEYLADLVIENKVIVELKAVNEIAPIHETQLVNYLRGTGLQVGLVLNFGNSLTFHRKMCQPLNLKEIESNGQNV